MENSFYRDKIRGCWLGKCLGGAVGMPFEGVPFTVALSENEISLQDVPNDDLELQLVRMNALKQYGVSLTSGNLAEYWLKHIRHGCDEYSIALHNMAHGILPPASGWKNNFFADGMGAAIRSEIWALVFADSPEAAAYFAQQDAEVDHWGDGVRGEIFLATAEAHACLHSDIEEALRFAFRRLDGSSRLAKTLGRVFMLYDSGVGDTEAAKELLLTEQRNSNFTDCVMNLAFIVHSLLRGNGDFLKTVLTVISFGRDTDCTAASCGAFLGIAKGEKVFPEKWRNQVKNELCLSPFVTEIPGVPLTLDELVEQTFELHQELADHLRGKHFPEYVPYVPESPLPETDYSEWLILDGAEFDIPALEKQLRDTGKCPRELKKYIVSFTTLFMDLSHAAGNYNALHLFSFLTVNNSEIRPEEVVLSATADVGHRLWMDGRRVMNHHSRQKMLPSFHRAEGGAAFSLPLSFGETHLFHWELFFCHAPMKACLMFGNLRNDHLDGFQFRIN